MNKKILSLIVLIFIVLSMFSVYAEDENKIKLKDTLIQKSEDVSYNEEDGNHVFNIDNGESLTTDYKGKETRTYAGFKDDAQFIFNEDGKLKQANFITNEERTYKFGNKEVKIPANSEVEYKDGKLKIALKSNIKLKEIKKPSEINDFENVFIQYTANSFILPNGEKINIPVNYDRGFYINQETNIGNVEIKNPNKIKTYLFFDGKIHNEIKNAYISMNEKQGKFVLGCNTGTRGPVVRFKNGNPYGIKIEKGDNFAMQALGNSEGSYISIQKRDKQGKVPIVKTLNQFAMNQDNKGVYYHSQKQKLFLRPKEVIINDFGTKFQGSSTTPLEIHNFKTLNNKIVSVSKYGNVLGIGNRKNIGYGKNPHFIRTHKLSYYKKLKAPYLYTGFSNKLIYNYDLSEKGFEKLTGVDLRDYVGVTRNPDAMRMVYDMFMRIPLKKGQSINDWGIRIFNIVGPAGWAGLAEGGGEMSVSYSNGGFDPDTIIHEMAHMHDFTFRYNSQFEREWNAVGGSSWPHTYSYGYTDAEDTSTFAQMAFKNSWYRDGSGTFNSWKGALNKNYPYHKIVRGKLAVFARHGFISKTEAHRIFSLAGLSSDDASLKKYIQEAINFRRSL